MEDYPHPVSLCTIANDEGTNEQTEDSCIYRETFKIENITVAKPPLLKIYYWQSLDIESLNDKLLHETYIVEHHMELPTRQLNSKPLKIVFWLRNLCDQTLSMHLKRLQNCQCVPLETRVGFNQFRYLYHCPHRRLVNILQEEYVLKPNELVAMSMVAYYFIIGAHILSYELRVSECLTVILHFHVNIITFDPIKSVLTTKMLPVNIKEHRSLYQSIWIRNVTMQNVQYIFSSRERGFRIINPDLIIPRQSVWPLIVEFIPNDFENKLELVLNLGEKITNKRGTGNRYKISLNCKGYIENEKIEHDYNVPLLDYEFSDFLYVIYPNKLVFEAEVNDEKTLMVAIHNYDQKCVEFRWQPYSINEYFRFTFEPTNFTLKPHHSKLCVVQVNTFAKPLHFARIPAVLEVHRILDKSTQIAKQLLTEIESIDDPKWAEDSYMEHVLLHIDLKVNFPKLLRQIIEEDSGKKPAAPLVIPMSTEQGIETNEQQQQQNSKTTTIFEKLFWEYLSKSNYMRNTSKIPRNLTYEQVLNKETCTNSKESLTDVNKLGCFNILSLLMAESCRDLSKNYRFLPLDL